MCDGAYRFHQRITKELKESERKQAKEKAKSEKWFKSLTPERQKVIRESDARVSAELRRENFWNWVILLGIFFGPPVLFLFAYGG